jgi:hypothetical protein
VKFEGQVLVISTTDPGGGGVIQSPELVEIEGRKFIRGTAVMLDDEGPKWTSGLHVWIAIDHITTITEVPSVDEYVRRCGLHKQREEAKYRPKFGAK